MRSFEFLGYAWLQYNTYSLSIVSLDPYTQALYIGVWSCYTTGLCTSGWLLQEHKLYRNSIPYSVDVYVWICIDPCLMCFYRYTPTVAYVESTSLTDSILRMNYQQSLNFIYLYKTRYISSLSPPSLSLFPLPPFPPLSFSLTSSFSLLSLPPQGQSGGAQPPAAASGGAAGP